MAEKRSENHERREKRNERPLPGPPLRTNRALPFDLRTRRAWTRASSPPRRLARPHRGGPERHALLRSRSRRIRRVKLSPETRSRGSYIRPLPWEAVREQIPPRGVSSAPAQSASPC